MRIMKIRRVGNSNVVSLPHELEGQGYAPGRTVLIEKLETGELRITPTSQIRHLTRERAEQLVAENREALELLAQDDGVVQEINTAADS
jgi:antitoxin component of MazEF toxin-antitoxin module